MWFIKFQELFRGSIKKIKQWMSRLFVSACSGGSPGYCAGGPSVSEQHGWESTVSQLIGGPNAAQQTMQLGFVLFFFSSHKRFCFTCVTSTIAARDPLRCDIFFFFFGRRLDACVSRGPCDVPGRADAEQRLSVGACLYKPCQRARPRVT